MSGNSRTTFTSILFVAAASLAAGPDATTSQQPEPAPSKAFVDEDAGVAEAMRSREQKSQLYDAMNKMTPTAEPIPAKSGSSLKGFLLFLLADLNVIRVAGEIYDHPLRWPIIFLEILMLIIFIVTRAWKLEHAEETSEKLWINIWTTTTFFIVAVAIVPRLFLAKDHSRNLLEGTAEIAREPAQETEPSVNPPEAQKP